MRIAKSIYRLLSSPSFLIWLAGGWLMYYTFSAIWFEEAFASFVSGTTENILLKIPFVAFLLSGYLNVVRAFKSRLQQSRTGFAAWFISSTGILLYLTGFFLSLQLRQYESLLIGSGDMLRTSWMSETYRVASVDPGIKEHITVSGEDTPVLEREPRVVLTDSRSRRWSIGAYPPARRGLTYLHILNTGIAPGVQLYENDRLIQKGYMALRLLPPGQSDFFDIAPYPYRFLTALSPSESAANVFDISNPIYNTRVFKGEKLIAEQKSSSFVKFDRYELRYFKPKYWAQVEVARDPGIPLMRLGIFLAVFSLPVYLIRLITLIPKKPCG
jgi:hypothetical protein